MAANNPGKYLHLNRRRKENLGLKAERTSEVITHDPETIAAGGTLYVKIPPLEPDFAFVPNTLRLTFSIVLSGNKDNFVVNNLGRNIIVKKVSRIGGDIVRIVENCHLYDTFRDLWKTTTERTNMIFQGVQSTNLRKLRSKASSADTTIEQDNIINQVFENRYMIPLDLEIYTDHIPFYPNALKVGFVEELTFAPLSNVIVSSDVTGWNYSINNIKLEYDTIRDNYLCSKINELYFHGISFLYDYVSCETGETGSSTLINRKINVPRRSLKGILLLFEPLFADGARDSENFVNPFITNIKIQIAGVGSKIYKDGYKAYKQWEECRKHFAPSEAHKDNDNLDINEPKFYGDNKFALWMDFRSTEDVNLHGSGLAVANDSIQLEIKRTSTTNYNMYTFLVSDAKVDIKENALKGNVF